MYSQLCYWQHRMGDDAWFYKTYDEMSDELALSEYKLRRAYKTLKDKGWLEMKLKKADGQPTLHFRILRNLSSGTEKTSDSMGTEKTSDSINNKLPINKNNKESEKISDSESDFQVEQIYRLYLRMFIDVDVEKAAKRYRLTPKRRTKIKARLKDAGIDMLGAAIRGYAMTPFYNRPEWRAELESFICRSYEQVEKGARLYQEAQQNNLRGRMTNEDDPWKNL